MTMRRASKSTPVPTVKSFIAPIMFARSVWPAPLSASTTTSCDVPSGNCAARAFEATPSKMMFVASPRIFGAITARKTPIGAEDRDEDEGDRVRLQEADQPAEALAEVGGLAGLDAVPVAGVLAGLLGELEFEALLLGEGVGSAHASTPSCDSTISR